MSKTKGIDISDVQEYIQCPLRHLIGDSSTSLNNTEAFEKALEYSFIHALTIDNFSTKNSLTLKYMQKVLWKKWKDIYKKPSNKGIAIYANKFLCNIIEFISKRPDLEKLTGHHYDYLYKGHHILGNVDLTVKIDNSFVPVYPMVASKPISVLTSPKIMMDLIILERGLGEMPSVIGFFDISSGEILIKTIKVENKLIKHFVFNIIDQYIDQKIYTIASRLCSYCKICDKIDKGELKMTEIQGDVIIIKDKKKKREDIVLTANIVAENKSITDMKSDEEEENDGNE